MSKKKIKVKDNPTLVRDSFSKAIINSDRNNYAKVKARKKLLLEKDEKLDQLESDVAEMKELIKDLFKRIKTNK